MVVVVVVVARKQIVFIFEFDVMCFFLFQNKEREIGGVRRNVGLLLKHIQLIIIIIIIIIRCCVK